MASLPLTNPLELPLYMSPPRRFKGRWRTAFLFFCIAALSGMVFQLIVLSHSDTLAGVRLSGWSTYSSSCAQQLSKAEPKEPPPISQVDYADLSLEELRELVSHTNGFFARDWSLGLGWNNMRYIIEAAALKAELVNRTLVLPSFVYARACEYGVSACADYATMVNRNDAIFSDEWRYLPYESQMAWRIPITVMFNVTRLRARHPVILTSDYLRLHGLSPDIERSNGGWLRDVYHSHANVFARNQSAPPSLHVVENKWFDPPGVVNRVDHLTEEMKARGKWDPDAGDQSMGQRGGWPAEEAAMTDVSFVLHLNLQTEWAGQTVIDWEVAKALLAGTGYAADVDLEDDAQFEKFLQENGWEVLHTFRPALGQDFGKSAVDSMRQIAPRYTIRGWADDYKNVDADVLLLAGETHLGRKPGGLRFTTIPAREEFSDLVLRTIVTLDHVQLLAERLAERMRNLVGGRLWLGAHMRRGDFVNIGWVQNFSPEEHIQRVEGHLSVGRDLLASMQPENLTTYDIPGVSPDMDQVNLSPPLATDSFYIATDERDPLSLAIIASHGAVFFDDLLTTEDRRAFGWPLMLTDVRALVEQAVLGHSAYFCAHAMSSVAGGVVNLRAARGADPRTLFLD